MIVETLPEVQKLSDEDKFLLAAELVRATSEAVGEEPDPEIVRLLDARMAEYRADPSSASPWHEVKARILASRDR